MVINLLSRRGFLSLFCLKPPLMLPFIYSFVVFKDSCSPTYYDCQLNNEGTQWIITQLTCDSGLFFDPETLTCTSKYYIDECNFTPTSTTRTTTTSTTTTSTTTTTTTTITTTTTDASSVCKKPGLNPDPNFPRDCNIVSL